MVDSRLRRDAFDEERARAHSRDAARPRSLRSGSIYTRGRRAPEARQGEKNGSGSGSERGSGQRAADDGTDNTAFALED